MPNHLNPGALLTIMVNSPPGKSLPWDLDRWQELTTIRHGLNPPDDKDLPFGWTRKQAQDVETFISAFKAMSSVEERIRFATAKRDEYLWPGRALFRTTVTEIWSQFQIHEKILDVLTANNLHPVTVALGSGRRSLDEWPEAHYFIPYAISAVAQELFGVEALDDFGRVDRPFYDGTHAIIYRTSCNLRSQVKRTKGRIEKLEGVALAAFESE